MSKGPGHIERKLVALFESSPDGAFSTNELVTSVYGINRPSKKDEDLMRWIAHKCTTKEAADYYGVERLQKKHEVAVLRTAHKLKCIGWTSLRGESWGRELIFYNTGSAYSYALARLRGELSSIWTLEQLEAKLAEDEYVKRIAPGGTWWMFAQEERAALGFEIDPETRRLMDIAKAKNEAALAALGIEMKAL